jgi:hypothetical protein
MLDIENPKIDSSRVLYTAEAEFTNKSRGPENIQIIYRF